MIKFNREIRKEVDKYNKEIELIDKNKDTTNEEKYFEISMATKKLNKAVMEIDRREKSYRTRMEKTDIIGASEDTSKITFVDPIK